MGIDDRGTCPHFLKWRLCVVFQSVFEVKFLHVFKYWLTTVFAWFGFETCIKANSPLVNCLIIDTAGCLFTFQSDATLKLISWFSVFNFIKKIKHAGDGIFSCASLCQNLSDCGIILQRYCTQLFFSVHPHNFDSTISHLQTAVHLISSWMSANLLTLNSSKTEFPIIGLKQQLSKIYNSSLNTTHSARNLGFIFHEHLTFSDQISSLSKSCYSHIRQLRDIRPYFDSKTASTIAPL